MARSGRSRWSAGRRRKTPLRRADPRNDRPDHPDRGPWRACGPRRRRRRACIRCCWRSAASATSLIAPLRRPQEFLTCQRHSGPGTIVAGEVSADRRARGRPDLDIHDIPRSSGICSSASTGPTTCTSRPARRSTRWITRARPERGLEGGDRGGGPAARGAADAAARRSALARRLPHLASCLPGILAVAGPPYRRRRVAGSPRSARRSSGDPIRAFR